MFKNIFSKNAKYSEEFPRLKILADATLCCAHNGNSIHRGGSASNQCVNEPMCQLTKNGPLCSSLRCSKPVAI